MWREVYYMRLQQALHSVKILYAVALADRESGSVCVCPLDHHTLRSFLRHFSLSSPSHSLSCPYTNSRFPENQNCYSSTYQVPLHHLFSLCNTKLENPCWSYTTSDPWVSPVTDWNSISWSLFQGDHSQTQGLCTGKELQLEHRIVACLHL